MKRLLLIPLSGLPLLALVVVLLLASNFYTFSRLTDESPIAELSFAKRGAQQYAATISYGDFCSPEVYLLYGDQWRLDAQFLKWRPWANLLGFDSMYRIERLGGRYSEVTLENTQQQAAYQLRPVGLVDLTSLFESYHGVLSPVDTLYGSSVYDRMDEGYTFRVYRGQSGLLVRKERSGANSGSAAGITIDINPPCGQAPGLLRRLVAALEAGVRSF